ncbi:hypothetical protein GGR57DRAFT_504560 [Xylariaceae sp. FL1272]|nr:hypothetical protein GGR57DRAFT_504560 [Xylariaceae sp. FL1272]
MSVQTPTFDYYAELGVAEAASTDEIKSAYRRAAQIHHPDKNPNNVEEATRRFQRIQQAYETLSHPGQRMAYDALTHAAGSDDSNDVDIGMDAHYYAEMQREYFERQIARALAHAEAIRRAEERREMLEKALTEIAKRQAKEEAIRKKVDEIRKSDEEKQRKEEERKARLQEEKDAAERERLVAIQEETSKQEARWKAANAQTKEQKTAHCLHSDRCEKITQRKKVKCEACGAKRGMITFKCPYCESHLCQLCVAKSAEQRAQDEKPKPKSKLATQEVKSGGQNTEPKAKTPSPTSKVHPQPETEEAKHPSPTMAGDDESKPMTPKRKKKKSNKTQVKSQNEPIPTKPQPSPKPKPPSSTTASPPTAPSGSNVDKPFDGKKKGASKAKACYNCGNTSHYAYNCPETERRCFNCHYPGHRAKNCPAKD